MTVYVDPIREYPRESIQPSARRWGNTWCHMFSDEEDKSSLHEMARKIGHKIRWFQKSKDIAMVPMHSLKYDLTWEYPGHISSHYDLTPNRRIKAIQNGAQELSYKELILRYKTNGEN